jgi:ribosomal protein L34
VGSSPDRTPMGSEKATSFQAKGKFGVSGYQFYRMWNEVMKARPDAKWTKHGRRSDSTSGHGVMKRRRSKGRRSSLASKVGVQESTESAQRAAR